MKKFLIALFMIFACSKTFAEPVGGFIPPIPPIYAHPDVVEYAIKKYVVAPYDPNKVTAAYEQYMNQNDGTITLENLQQKVCPAGGMDKTHCKEFTDALMIYYYDVCDSGKGKSGGNEHCEKNFFYYAAPKNLSFGNGTYVRLKEAIGLAQEYALVKDKQKVVCVSTKGNSKKTDTIWCTSIDKKHFYEFKFNNIKETKDDYIKQSVLRAVCKMYNTTYTAGSVGVATIGDAPGLSYPDSCETDNQFTCGNINKSLSRFSYKSQIGTSDVPPAGKHTTCVIERVIKDVSNLRTAYGIDNTVFKNVQVLAGEDVDNKIKQYVKQELQKQKITFNEKTFHCAGSTNVISTGEVITCYVNDKPIDFLFADLSEWKGINKRGGAQAMDCIVSGGTYTGKRCINLNQKQCEMLRSANLKSCPSCNMVRWDAKNKVCTLPSSAAATNFQKDIKLVGMAAGAVASVAITIATAGTAGLTIGGYIILGVETTGAGLELWSQSKINKLSDEFFLKSNNCYSENCAAQLIETYLTDLAAIDRDLTKDEADAVDKEMARLFELIPTDSHWWINNLRTDDGESFLEKADDGHWTAAQIWRAVGIGMQFAGVASSITGWIIEKTGYLEKALDRTSKILLNNAKIAEKNIVKYENLSDIDKEFWVLWKEYAPKNQTFEQFKAMANGDLNEMKKMAAGWRGGRSSRQIIRQEVPKQIDELKLQQDKNIERFNNLLDEYYDKYPNKKFEELLEMQPDLKEARDAYLSTQSQLNDLEIELLDTPYSTYDPEFTRISKQYQQKIDDIDARSAEAWNDYLKTHPSATIEEYRETETFKKLVDENRAVRREYQFKVAEEFQLENLGNVVNDRANEFAEIVANNPEVQAKLNDFSWSLLSDQERADVAQQILNEYATKTNTPEVVVGLDYNTVWGGYYTPGTNNVVFSPTAQLTKPDGMVETMAHEHGHLIDDLAPNEGAVGEQFNHYANQMYSNRAEDGYRVALTEQSSYKIGPNVANRATGTTNPSYGMEYDLENAKALKESPDFLLGIIASAPTGVGTEIGIIEQIHENRDKKNIFQKYNEQKKDTK